MPRTHDRSPRGVVESFLLTVRSGHEPDRASEFMAPEVLAHQVHSEDDEVVRRSPEDYAEHVREMVQAYGDFELTIEELLADGDKVYARWRQVGRHLAPVDGAAPTGRPVVQMTSCVYRVEDGRIAEYWIQIDRAGLAAQLHADEAPDDRPGSSSGTA